MTPVLHSGEYRLRGAPLFEDRQCDKPCMLHANQGIFLDNFLGLQMYAPSLLT